MSGVKLEHIYKRFGKVTAVGDFNIEVKDGEFVSFLGPSGCGKTTTLRMVAGFEKPTEGTITIGDTVMSDASKGFFMAPENRGVGMVFQSYAVWPHMNVIDNVAYPLKIQKVPKEERLKRVMNILEVVHLQEYAERLPNQLSGGQQQRVALARALVAEPGLLLLDEPLSNLDAGLRVKMRQEIRELQEKTGVTTLFITHDQQEALSISHRIAVIDRGAIRQVGTPSEIYNTPADSFVAGFVGKANRLSPADAEALGLDAAREGFIRPEGLILRPGGSGRVPVTVKRVVFDGPCFHYTVAAPGGLYEVSMLNRGTPPFAVGQQLCLSKAGDRGDGI